MSSTRMQFLPLTSPMMFITSEFARALAALVDDGERRVDALGERAGAHHAADVGRNNHDIGQVELVLDVAHQHWRAEQVVGRDVEKALDLASVEIDRQHAVGAGAGDQVGDEFSGNRRARTGLPVLPGIAEIGDDGGDAPGRSATQRVGHDQRLHQVIVGRRRRGLNDERVLSANVFLDLDKHFHVGEAPNLTFGQGHAEIGGDRFRQRTVGIARQDFHRTSHEAPLHCPYSRARLSSQFGDEQYDCEGSVLILSKKISGIAWQARFFPAFAWGNAISAGARIGERLRRRDLRR